MIRDYACLQRPRAKPWHLVDTAEEIRVSLRAISDRIVLLSVDCRLERGSEIAAC